MLLRALAGFAALAAATPIDTVTGYVRALELRESTSVQDYTDMKFYVQHAAAAYCNFKTKSGTAIACGGANSCPLVQQSGAIVVSSFVGHKTGIGAYVAVDQTRREIVLAVRGSNNIRNFITDVVFAWQDCAFVDNCKVHTGFADSWQELQDMATSAIGSANHSAPGFRIVATGHSLGGAVATLAAAYLRQSGFPVDVYTYGSPRVGNEGFANWMTDQPGGEWRVTHQDDPVPRLPPLFFGYRHISPEYWLAEGKQEKSAGVLRTRDDADPTNHVEVCTGTANLACNGGTLGLNIPAHLDYWENVGACGGFPLQWKRDSNITFEELEQRLSEWALKDQTLIFGATS